MEGCPEGHLVPFGKLSVEFLCFFFFFCVILIPYL
jgi:hypothetical protein